MLTIADHLLGEAERRGVLIRVEHGQVRFDGPKSALDERFVSLLRANDRMILQRLARAGSDGRWLKQLTPGRGEALLFLMPAAGTGPERYRSWQAAAPDGLEIVAVQPPGREERFGETSFTDVAPLADEIAERVSDLVAADPGRPFGIFGHSTGGLVAYEVTRRVARSPGLRFLAVAACSPPDLVRTHLTRMTEEELLLAMAEWTDTPHDVLTESGLITATLPCLRADLSVHVSCRRSRADSDVLDVPIAALCGVEDRTTPQAECATWESWTKGDFVLHEFEGGHFFPVSAGEQVLRTLADRLLANG